jgi:hypothetical protein
MRTPGAALGATLVLAVIAVMPVSAQDTSHPAGIYVGSCPVPGNMLVSLWDVSPNFLVDGEADAGPVAGSDSGFPVEGSVTVVEFPLADLVATQHAILVHRSVAEIDDYLVCGDIGGAMVGPDELPVALAPVGLSPWSGIVLLDDEGNGTTTVSVSIFEGPGVDTGAQEPMGPVPSPAPSGLQEDDVVPASPRDDDDGGVDDRDDDQDETADDGDGDTGDNAKTKATGGASKTQGIGDAHASGDRKEHGRGHEKNADNPGHDDHGDGDGDD